MFVIESILLAYFIYAVSYSFFFGVSGLFYKKHSKNTATSSSKYLVLVPGYKEDAVIIDTTSQNLKINYPENNYRLTVVADSFEKRTLDTLRSMPIDVIEVSFEKSTKVKAMKKALKQIDEQYDYIVILDADNVMDTDFLIYVDSLIQHGKVKALQGQRAPKNKNNELAVLDGISEAINNHIYRMGHSCIGFSSALNGSGMVFKFDVYKNIILEMESIGGFDRELEYKLLEQGIKVKYLKEAIVYDEKVDNNKTFENQRKRWISSQYVYLAKYFLKGVRRLIKGDVVYFNSTVWRNIQLPRLINLGLLTIITILSFLLVDVIETNYQLWLILWIVNTVSIAISIPRSFYNKDLIKALILLPELFLKMFRLIFKLKGANKKFIHTPHKTTH